MYTFRKTCQEDRRHVLDDERTTILLNTKGDRTGINKNLSDLLEYIETGRAVDEYTRALEHQVQAIREDDDWRKRYMTLEMKLDEKLEEGMAIGMKQGIEQGIRKSIQFLLDANMSMEEVIAKVAKGYDYSEEEVLKIWKTK